ncbi:MAG: bifunctional aspartate kinase/homoserine dehydrogenase I [Bacteroidetes bacterium]|nr:MAG: bifunctional aspartate kinase/homoserine dehydrogenase I [Bacteroidota bacterium]
MKTIVMKFGGSSVGTPERIKNAAHIALEASKKNRIILVVSAFYGITDRLLECARAAEQEGNNYDTLFDAIAERHWSAARELHGGKINKSLIAEIQQLLDNLHDILHGVNLLRHCPPRALDLTASFGERLSALIISAYINRKHPSLFADARHFVVTDDQFTHAEVLFEQTNAAVQSYFKNVWTSRQRNAIPVVTGFVGSTEDGRTTTIGRNGSDYTAAILGAALNVSVIEIWTDVDGVLSADPREVSDAFVLPSVSFEEALELSYFGAKVLHPATIAPAIARNIPIHIKNTLNPTAPGTLIGKPQGDAEPVAKGITSIDHVTLLNLRGIAMVGVPGTAERLFRSLASHKVNVILISQASSEHTICFAVKTQDVVRARKAIQQEFTYELSAGVTAVDERPAQTIIAIVGEGMKGIPGVSGKVFQSLGLNNINISAIAQGSSERNISFVTDSQNKTRAINVIHQAFFEERKRLYLAVVGVGNIGATLLKQLHQQRQFLLNKGFDVRVCAVADSKRFVVNHNGLDLTRWQDVLHHSQHKMDLHLLAHHIADLKLTNVALVDCTASSEVVNAYPVFVQANMHIITPNKKANVLPIKEYNTLVALLNKRKKFFLYEANVGAGLPIISTLHDLIASGDTIVKIEGVFSGTLSFLFNSFNGTTPFSKLVHEAQLAGYTEPDPREDLSGQDVARKLLILARQLGWNMDLNQIPHENLVPAKLQKGAFSKSFHDDYAKHDAEMNKRYVSAQKRGAVLRYVGVLNNKKAMTGLLEYPANHPFAGTKGSDNIIAFTTQRYSKTPLVVQGPGAGADVTAMGVFSDILKLLNYLAY